MFTEKCAAQKDGRYSPGVYNPFLRRALSENCRPAPFPERTFGAPNPCGIAVALQHRLDFQMHSVYSGQPTRYTSSTNIGLRPAALGDRPLPWCLYFSSFALSEVEVEGPRGWWQCGGTGNPLSRKNKVAIPAASR